MGSASASCRPGSPGGRGMANQYFTEMERKEISKTPKACDACRRRKLKCPRKQASLYETLEDSRCLRCQKTNLLCTYNDEYRKRGPKTGKRLNAIRASQASRSPGPVAACGNEMDPFDELLPNGPFLSQSPAPFDPPVVDEAGLANGHVDGSIEPEGARLDLSAIQSPWSSLFPPGSADVSDGPLENPSAVSFDFGQLSAAPVDNSEEVSLSRQEIMAELALFFTESYQRYPVVHLETVLRNIDHGEHLRDSSFRTLLFSIFLLNEASQFRHSPGRGMDRLELLSRVTERSRMNSNGYHFADSPSLDAVFVSLVLFIAYSVRDQHNRAFLYLSEAIGLMDLVGYPCSRIEIARYHRIERLLFVTEAASNSIYGAGRRRIAREPSNPTTMEPLDGWHILEDHLKVFPPPFSALDYNTLDKQALHLLNAMTRLYGAVNTAEVTDVAFRDDFMAAMVEGDERKPSCSIQTADVAITRQWQLASHWWRALSNTAPTPQTKASARYTIQIMGMTAVQQSRFLLPGYCRIVGHGKLAALADAMLNISSTVGILPSCSTLIRDLIRIVSEADYEKSFAPELSLVEICIGEVPRLLTSVTDVGSIAPDTESAATELWLT